MRAHVRFRLPDGSLRELGHGDQVGRLWSMALQLDDPRVSEAHAMVSLRGDQLRLLALRRMFLVDGKPVGDAVLTPGLEIGLAPDLAIVVESVDLPDEVLALEADGMTRQILGGVCSVLVERGVPRLVSRSGAADTAQIWGTGEGWRVRLPGEASRDLAVGDAFTIAGCTIRAVGAPLRSADSPDTRLAGGVASPLTIVTHFDTVHIQRADRPPLVLSGLPARIVSELGAVDGPLAWEVLAREVWRDDVDKHTLRRRLDMNLSRLRKRLQDAQVRADLVRPDGAGSMELLLYPDDVLDDQT